jgi:predicted nucleotidyltransferase
MGEGALDLAALAESIRHSSSSIRMWEVRDVVLAHAPEIRSLLARRNAVDIRVFGSVARGDDSPGSDVDFLVEFGPEASILDQVHLELDLMALLDCEVDVVPLGGLKKRDTHVLAEAVAATRGDDLRVGRFLP